MGYKGRTGVFELLVIDDQIRELVSRSACAKTIRACAKKNGMNLLQDSCLGKVKKGEISLEEFLRVLGGN